MFKNCSNVTGIFCILILFFCVLGCRSITGGYSVSDGNVYYNDGQGGMLPFGSDEVLKNADAKTFEIFNKYYGKDKNRVYFEGKEFAEIDVRTFQFIEYVYSKDKSNVYYKKNVLTDKPQTFKILFLDSSYPNYIDFSTDGTHIFSRGKLFQLSNVDLATFERVGKTGYVRDKNRVYDYEKEVYGADPKTFEVINHSNYDNTYAKDKSSIFYNGSRVKEADLTSHKIIDYKYHKDKNYVFKEKLIVSNDPENFQIPKQSFSIQWLYP